MINVSGLAYAAAAFCIAVLLFVCGVVAFTKPARLAALEPLPAVRWEQPGENR